MNEKQRGKNRKHLSYILAYLLVLSIIPLGTFVVRAEQNMFSVSGQKQVTADDGKVTPDDGKVTPDDGKVTPDDGRVTPDDGKVTPDDGTATDGDIVVMLQMGRFV